MSDSSATARLIDLSHTVEHSMITYKGLPAPIICDYLSRDASRAHYAEGTEFQIGKIEMIANTGTYVDSPFHRYAQGRDLSERALESLANLDCVVIRATERSERAIDRIPIELATLKARRSSCTRDGTRTGAPIATSKVART
jgi:arylformamidase